MVAPRAGLAESTLQVVRAAVTDADTVARYRSKIRVVAGSSCAFWNSAVSGRGHGRFWVGTVEGRDVVMIAHRFGWAVRYGVDALDQVPVLGHRCDNPLCQWIGSGHVEASSGWRNRQEWVMRRHTIGAPLRDARGARGRSRALRDAVRRDPTAVSLAEAIQAGMTADAAQLPLWGEAVVVDAVGSAVVIERGRLADEPLGSQDLDAVLSGAALAGGRRDGDGVPSP